MQNIYVEFLVILIYFLQLLTKLALEKLNMATTVKIRTLKTYFVRFDMVLLQGHRTQSGQFENAIKQLQIIFERYEYNFIITMLRHNPINHGYKFFSH